MLKKKAAHNLGVHFLYQKDSIPSNKEIRKEFHLLVHQYQNPRHEKEDVYQVFKLFLLPLENIKGQFEHPEGDMLYHSLQVFELAKEWHSYDVEFLQAALLHDIGKAIDPQHHDAAGAHALENFVSERVFFLIRYHTDAQRMLRKKLGHKQKLFLKQSVYFEDLMEITELNQKGRQPGMEVVSLDEALSFIQQLEQEIEGI